MDTNVNQVKTRERIDELIREYLGSSTDFNIERYLRTRGVQDFSHLNQVQKKQFAEDLVDKVIRPATSTGKTSMARVKLMSILSIGVEPWKITPDYVPSPREYLLSHEINDEYKKLNQAIYAEIIKKNIMERVEPDPETKAKVVNSIISSIFGTMTKTTLLYTKKLFNLRPTEWVVKNSLSTYMNPEEAAESSKNFTQLFDTGVKAKDEQIQTKDLDLKLLSEKLRDDFTDDNQVVIRRLKNELNLESMKKLDENKRQRILQIMMGHYFGQLSEKYYNMEIEKIKLSEESDSAAADKLRLVNAIINDCLRATMASEDAKEAHNDLLSLLHLK